MTYKVLITAPAAEMIRRLRRHGRGAIAQLETVIRDLADNPEAKTQPLHGVLAGYRSLHSGRFRIVVRIDRGQVTVFVVGVGWHESGDRDDVYQIIARLMARRGRP